MPTTTKMGIVYPASTDLVKNGATAMGTISTTVDSKTGLVLINTTSFSAVASVTLPANTFTSTFKNYRVDVYISATSGASAQIIYTRLRAGTSTDTSGNYDYTRAGYSYPGALNNDSGSGGTSWFWARSNGSGSFGGQSASSITLFRPQVADRTWFVGSVADGLYGGFIGGLHRSSTSYDSLEFGTSTGGTNITGTVNVYGYND